MHAGRGSGADGWSLRAALRLYGGAQRALPADLVRAHGDEMRDAFAARARASYAQGGAASLWPIVVRATADVLRESARARLHARRLLPDGSRRPSLGEQLAMMWNELRLAARNLARRPGFTLVAALTLALGIGANVAMFAVVHSVLIRPLPFPDSERIVWIRHHAPGLSLPELENSTGTLAVYREQAHSFAQLASVESTQRNISGGDSPARIDVGIVSPALFDVLGVQPALGRRLDAADSEPGAPRVAVLTHQAWSAHFGGAADVVGRVLELDGERTEIVGVMPRGFAYPEATTALLLPRPLDATPVFGTFGIGGIARLAPGVQLATAQAELEALQSRHAELYDLPADFFANAGWSVSVRPLHEVTVGDAAAMLWIVLGTVGFLLLVACASVANLFLVRAESRQREIGVRLALGATRARIAATLLSESLLLGLAGGLWGVVLAWNAVAILVTNGPPQLPRLHEVSVGAPVLLFAAAVSILAGLLFGLLPLAQQTRRAAPTIVRAGRGETAGRDRQRLRRGLIVAQIALALVLLTGSGLMLRSFQQLRALDPGVDPDGVLVVGVSGSAGSDAARNASRYLEMLHAVRGMPGADAVALANMLPILPDGANGGSFRIESRPRADNEAPPLTWWAAVSDGYAAAVGAPLLAGRDIMPAEVEHARAVILVNETFARRFLDDDAIGERIQFAGDTTWYDIVGVIGDVHAFGLREEVRPMAYKPLTLSSSTQSIQTVHIIARTARAPLALAQPIRALVRDVDPHAPVLAARTLEAVLAESLADVTFTSTVLALAALIALLLGAVGLYGVVSYAVAERTGEIGVRVALGASPAAVRTLVLRDGVLLGAVGVGLGLAGAAALTRLLESVLFEVSAHDPLTFVLVAGVLLGVTLLATWLPARRAARIDPLEAIRGTG